ncbi:hypothetical protein EON65_21175 [archaeon]|nr:MAG: hypothetical protein EON65_21175 [archaeon]
MIIKAQPLLTSLLLLSSGFVNAVRMQALRTDTIGGRGITYMPTTGKYDGVVVWMHGLGDTADGWASVVPELGLPNVKLILPTANNVAISINNGYKMPGNLYCI